MNKTKFEELKTYLEKELSFDSTSPRSIMEKQSRIPFLIQTILTIYSNEKDRLLEMQANLKKYHAKLYEKYRHPMRGDGIEYQFAVSSKSEADVLIEGEENYNQKALNLERQRLQVEFLDRSLQSIRDLSWTLKQLIEQKKFFEGN